MKKAVFLAVCITLFAAAPAMSLSVPTLINYQGVLTDANGNLITGTLTKTMIFAIYDAPDKGNRKWGEETQTVQIISGQFNVLLGSVLSSPAITTAFDGPDRYLSIKVDGVELLPRQQILSTGYAVQAENAVNAKESNHAINADVSQTVQGNELYIANGSVGINTKTPNANLKLDVQGKMSATAYCDQNGENCESPPMKFEVYHQDSTTWACVDKDVKDYCGDEDGCTIKLLLQHEVNVYDQVNVIEEKIYMEQSSLSSNKGVGTYGWTRQLGGGDYSWITGRSDLYYTIYEPWTWTYAYNYRHEYCPGQNGVRSLPHQNPYLFTFMSHPNIRSTVIVYDR